ncbi:putative ferric-chelate reductase 1 isoform X4 [Xyrichtys novacula]|uniref:Ferric-chelate reductase 1 isoform X4 n=1 Tax=Xyrichtys novacula TaxID=13765 RepID=A0AAV1HJW7_XYRNO|nr:putative ferric-chelate reductase 1 isoform X4 [Xyrichtys novacula]
MELSGESDGYMALTVSQDASLGGNDETYVCANDNGVLKFIPARLNNSQLTETMLNVNSVKGSINGSTIQCTFSATLPTQTTRTPNLALGISKGAFNSTSGTLGTPSTVFSSGLVDLGNPNATATNQITTTVAPTTGHAVVLQQSFAQALLMTVGMLCLAML